MQELLAGLDIGTTSVKAIVMTVQGHELGIGRAPMKWSRSGRGVETSPAAIVDSALEALGIAIGVALGGHEDLRVVSIGVSSMGESGVLVDSAGSPLGPVIAWHDSRDLAEVEDLASAIGPDEFSLRTGLPFRSQWSLTKHRWLRDNVPSVARAVRRFSIAEWVVHRLGGAPATELSLASRTGWLDLASCTPWAEALEWSGASGVGLGELVSAGTPLGRVPNDHDLPSIRGATLTVAGHDHQAAAIGAGAVGDGDELDSCGTAEALVRTVAPHVDSVSIRGLTGVGVSVGWHALKGHWSVLGGTKSGLLLGQVIDYLDLDTADFAALDRDAARVAPGRTRIEWRDGSFDVTGSDRPEDVWRAATRAVTWQVHELSEAISRQVGQRRRLVVVGGWAHNAALMSAKSEFLGNFRRSHVAEAGARGAAVIAGLAHGTYLSFDEAPTSGTEHDRCPS